MSGSAADPPASAGATDLAQQLKLATGPLHRQVERSGLMRRILAGDFVHADYVALLHDLAALYGTLEAALARHASHPWLATVIVYLQSYLFAVFGQPTSSVYQYASYAAYGVAF